MAARSPPHPFRGVSSAPTSKTRLYDQLGATKDATAAELKKAYRKKSLQLHPDKPGGDEKAFIEMKKAYDLLADPQKRKAYDRYGEDVLKCMEGDFSPEVVMSLFLNIGCFERVNLILLLTVLIGYLLLFPVLLCVRWDDPRSMTFGHVFIPIWITLGVTLTVCICCVHAPSTDPDADEESRRQGEEMRSHAFKLRVGGSIAVLVSGTLLILLVLRLDRVTDWSYFAVLWPWMVLELLLFIYKACSSESNFVIIGGDPAVLQKSFSARGCEWYTFLFCTTSTHILLIAFACLVALKKDGMILSWWAVFCPVWIDCILSVVIRIPWEARLRGDPGHLVRSLLAYLGWVCCLFLLCTKLAHPGSMPAYVVFLPLFIFAGCFCCILTCMVCFMSSDCVGLDDPEEGTAGKYYTSSQRGGSGSSAAAAGPSYGATGHGRG